MINDVNAKVEQVFAIFLLRGYQRTDVELQLVQHGFVHNAVAVYQVAEQPVFLNGGEVFFRHFQRAGTARVGLDGVHELSFFILVLSFLGVCRGQRYVFSPHFRLFRWNNSCKQPLKVRKSLYLCPHERVQTDRLVAHYQEGSGATRMG